jgi:hypothetical protein
MFKIPSFSFFISFSLLFSFFYPIFFSFFFISLLSLSQPHVCNPLPYPFDIPVLSRPSPHPQTPVSHRGLAVVHEASRGGAPRPAMVAAARSSPAGASPSPVEDAHGSRLQRPPSTPHCRWSAAWLHRAVVSSPTRASPPRRAIVGLCSTTAAWVPRGKGGKWPGEAGEAALLQLRSGQTALESSFPAASPAKLFWDPFGTASPKASSEVAGKL